MATRAKRADVGKVRQTARDVQLLTWTAQQYAVPMDLLQRLLGGVTRQRAYGVVSRWKQAGWAQSGQVDAGPPWVWPTQSIARAYLERDVTNWRPGLSRVAHLRAAAAVRFHQVGIDVERWIGERQLAASQFTQAGDKIGHRPDGVEILPDGQRIAIEIEISAKNPERLFNPAVKNGLLLEVANAAHKNECGAIAYWCTPAVRPVLEAAISRFRAAYPGKDTWLLRNIEEVAGWRVPIEG